MNDDMKSVVASVSINTVDVSFCFWWENASNTSAFPMVPETDKIPTITIAIRMLPRASVTAGTSCSLIRSRSEEETLIHNFIFYFALKKIFYYFYASSFHSYKQAVYVRNGSLDDLGNGELKQLISAACLCSYSSVLYVPFLAFLWTNVREHSGETVHVRRLVLAFAARICDKYKHARIHKMPSVGSLHVFLLFVSWTDFTESERAVHVQAIGPSLQGGFVLAFLRKPIATCEFHGSPDPMSAPSGSAHVENLLF